MPERDYYPSPWWIAAALVAVAACGFGGLWLTGITLGPAGSASWSEDEAAPLGRFETRYAITVLDEPTPRLPSADGERADVTLLHGGLVRDCTVFWVHDDWNVQCTTHGGAAVVVLESADER